MRRNFKYILQDQVGDQLARITLPFVFNIGTQFEDPHSHGTFEVYKIVKEPASNPLFYQIEVKFYCRKINDTPWLYDHLEKSEYLSMHRGAKVNI